LKKFIDQLDIEAAWGKVKVPSRTLTHVAPTIINESFVLRPNIELELELLVKNDTNFELYALAEIGPYTPILELIFTNIATQEREQVTVNCLDMWSHYNRIKCIKILWKKLKIGTYKLAIQPISEAAIGMIDLKKPVNTDVYPENSALQLPIEKLSCNVELINFHIIEA
jgi:hypothetical protein